jgi:hypothetical protein
LSLSSGFHYIRKDARDGRLPQYAVDRICAQGIVLGKLGPGTLRNCGVWSASWRTDRLIVGREPGSAMLAILSTRRASQPEVESHLGNTPYRSDP